MLCGITPTGAAGSVGSHNAILLLHGNPRTTSAKPAVVLRGPPQPQGSSQRQLLK
jgi:hypothetical protein